MDEAQIIVSISPLPLGLVSSWSNEEVSAFETEAIDRGIQNASARKIYEKNITLGKLQGKEVKSEARGTTMLTRIFLANDRQYVIGASFKKPDEAEVLVKSAFDTFEIIQNQTIEK